uniref:Uncharacterized protein n=1 Tax=Anguilla anguilla TaxID=7936 RepID=A0A0E9VL47_ANGAN
MLSFRDYLPYTKDKSSAYTASRLSLRA